MDISVLTLIFGLYVVTVNSREFQSQQKKLEKTFYKHMRELEAQLHSSDPGKDTVAKLAEEFRTFKDLTFVMLRLLQQQITECYYVVDIIETRHRRKPMLFFGVPETVNNSCSSAVLEIMEKRMGLKATPLAISFCHRVGAVNNERQRPILVWFNSYELRSAVWKAKSRLKGSPIVIQEYLTKPRQVLLAKARQHFKVKVGGNRNKVANIEELNALTARYPKMIATAITSGNYGAGVSGGLSKTPYINPRCTEAIDRLPLRPKVIWGYDRVKKKCLTYLYKQCGDMYSGNRFETSADCETTCRANEIL